VTSPTSCRFTGELRCHYNYTETSALLES